MDTHQALFISLPEGPIALTLPSIGTGTVERATYSLKGTACLGTEYLHLSQAVRTPAAAEGQQVSNQWPGLTGLLRQQHLVACLPRFQVITRQGRRNRGWKRKVESCHLTAGRHSTVGQVDNTLLGAPGSERRTGSRQKASLGPWRYRSVPTYQYGTWQHLSLDSCLLTSPAQHGSQLSWSPAAWLSRLKQRLGRRISDLFLPVFIFVISPRLFCQG